MTSNFAFHGVSAAGMSWTFRAPATEHPAIPATRAAAAAPRKRRAAAQTIAASVGGFY